MQLVFCSIHDRVGSSRSLAGAAAAGAVLSAAASPARHEPNEEFLTTAPLSRCWRSYLCESLIGY